MEWIFDGIGTAIVTMIFGPLIGGVAANRAGIKPSVIAFVAVVFIVSLGFAYFLSHSYTDATCTEPAICTICGKLRGEALGHEWMEATAIAPKTCKICGVTEGDPQVRQLDADELSCEKAGSKKFTIRKNNTLSVAPMALDTPIKACVQATVHIGHANVKEGDVKGDWGFWVRENGDTWKLMDKFEYGGTEMDVTFTFETPVSFDRYAVGYYEARSKFSYNAKYKITDAWVTQ